MAGALQLFSRFWVCRIVYLVIRLIRSFGAIFASSCRCDGKTLRMIGIAADPVVMYRFASEVVCAITLIVAERHLLALVGLACNTMYRC